MATITESQKRIMELISLYGSKPAEIPIQLEFDFGIPRQVPVTDAEGDAYLPKAYKPKTKLIRLIPNTYIDGNGIVRNSLNQLPADSEAPLRVDIRGTF